MSCRLGAWRGLAVVAGSLGSSAVWSRWSPAAQRPSGLLVCRDAWPSAASILLLFPRIPTLSLFRGLSGRRAFAGMASFLFDCSPSCISAGPQESQGPHGSAWGSHLFLMEVGWSLRLEGRASSCQIGSALWENQPLVLGNVLTLLHPSWFELFWWWLPAKLEGRCRWQSRVQAGRDRRLQQGGAALRWHSLSWGRAGHQTKSCQVLGFSHPGLFGVAKTVFDVLFGIALLGHWDS